MPAPAYPPSFRTVTYLVRPQVWLMDFSLFPCRGTYEVGLRKSCPNAENVRMPPFFLSTLEHCPLETAQGVPVSHCRHEGLWWSSDTAPTDAAGSWHRLLGGWCPLTGTKTEPHSLFFHLPYPSRKTALAGDRPAGVLLLVGQPGCDEGSGLGSTPQGGSRGNCVLLIK